MPTVFVFSSRLGSIETGVVMADEGVVDGRIAVVLSRKMRTLVSFAVFGLISLGDDDD